MLAAQLGVRPGDDRLPDLSPSGWQAKDDLAKETLAALEQIQDAGPPADADERRCAKLLAERLPAALALSATGEHLRDVRPILGSLGSLQSIFILMPTATPDDWEVISRRMARVPTAVEGYVSSLREGIRLGLLAAPRLVEAELDQLADWMAAGNGRGWYAELARGAAGADGSGGAAAGAGASAVPESLRTDLDRTAASAITAVADLRRWLAAEYLPKTDGTPASAGADRYRLGSRLWTGAELDLDETYAWGWSEYLSLRDELNAEAGRVLPGASLQAAMRHLDETGEAIEGVEQVRLRLQQLMDEAIADLDGTHFDLAAPIKVVEARIAPAGSAAAPYYSRPSKDFSRPGRTFLPTRGRTRFPLWILVSTWYHEGVPGHHLQLAQWTYLSERLSTYQSSIGSVSACSEGWALYAERLMDELGYLTLPGARLGYLGAQIWRAIRVVVDIGMHLQLRVPHDSPIGAGQIWTPELAQQFCTAHSGHDADYVKSEVTRYLGAPGQAISYKLGERAWLAGREAASSAHGGKLDLKSWHMAALSLGPLGLDDLTAELGSL
ncbi:MAG: DUF885 domain-containing protein [Acidimicrobiales bacterium]